ncbi:MAG: spore cortex biosynthesis protein YabQ [Lachnospiraceae bacterium]|nr:spore cortex biosynthesis protein YabQ [Lachnospiraceae bacterium]
MIAISEGIRQELVFLLISMALGEGLVVIYDFLRIFRRVIPHNVIWISVEDIVYCIICAFLIFGMIFQTNDGLVRGFSIGGICVGVLFYNHFVSSFFVNHISNIIRKILEIIKKGLKKVAKAVRMKEHIL